jgi:hypothetical protein
VLEDIEGSLAEAVDRRCFLLLRDKAWIVLFFRAAYNFCLWCLGAAPSELLVVREYCFVGLGNEFRLVRLSLRILQSSEAVCTELSVRAERESMCMDTLGSAWPGTRWYVVSRLNSDMSAPSLMVLSVPCKTWCARDMGYSVTIGLGVTARIFTSFPAHGIGVCLLDRFFRTLCCLPLSLTGSWVWFVTAGKAAAVVVCSSSVML